MDTHTAVWDWDDGTTSAGTVTESGGSGTVSNTHTYTQTGIYTIQLTVTDNHGASGSSVFEYVVIYDPDGGFVTGGGWIMSPPGAYTPDPTLTGRANFGFVSKYKKGRNYPEGNTEFNFQLGNFNFHSTSYAWLVVAGARAQYKGTGTVNNSGNYGFLLTAIDGQIPGGGGQDKFRIKVWDMNNNNAVVYDNQFNAPDDADPTTVISGGQIVIHK
jgi:PKD repeat protein